MKNHRAELRKAGGAIAAFMALAALALLSLFGGHPQPAAIDEDSYTAAETNLFKVVNGYYVLADPVGRVWATVVPVTATP